MLLDTITIPLFVWSLILAGFGVIIGSFLNVYIYRFHTGKSLAGHSHCLSCGVQLRWFDLFPLFSYLWLQAKCRACGCHIPVRYFLVELLTAILFFNLPYITTDVFAIILYAILMSVLVVIIVYDYNHFIIPDSLTFVSTSILAILFAYQTFFYNYPVQSVLIDVGAALCGAGFLLFLWLISKGKWLGFGDVKLAVPLGLLVGAMGVFSFIVMSFWIGAIISLGILGAIKLKRGKKSLQLASQNLTIKSAIPFAPFMIVSALLVFFLHINVLTFFSSFA